MASAKKGSLAARRDEAQTLARLLERFEGCEHLVEHIQVQGVVHPATFLSIADDPGILERAQVKRKERLPHSQRPGQVADALFAVPQAVDDLQARLIGQGMEATTDALTGLHAPKYIK